MGFSDWRLPLNMTLGFHLLLLLSAMILPDILQNRAKIPENYTVDLVNIAMPEPAPQELQPAETEAKLTPPDKPLPVAPPKAISIAEPEPVPPPAAKKAVSLRPLKRKIKKKITPAQRIQETNKRQNRRADAQRKRIAQVKRAEEQADQANKEALNALKEMLQTTSTATSSEARQKSPSASNLSVLEAQYASRIHSHLHKFWILPDIKPWNQSLEAIVIITVLKDGTLSRHFFEKRSGDRVFDQFVKKTLDAANPLPKIPAAMKMQQWEIGLRFRPGSIQ